MCVGLSSGVSCFFFFGVCFVLNNNSSISFVLCFMMKMQILFFISQNREITKQASLPSTSSKGKVCNRHCLILVMASLKCRFNHSGQVGQMNVSVPLAMCLMTCIHCSGLTIKLGKGEHWYFFNCCLT